MGGLPKFRLEMARHQERVAQPSAAAPMQDALTALLNGRIAPILAVPAQSEPSRKRPFAPIGSFAALRRSRAAPDKVKSSRISANLIRNGSVALAQLPAQEKSERI